MERHFRSGSRAPVQPEDLRLCLRPTAKLHATVSICLDSALNSACCCSMCPRTSLSFSLTSSVSFTVRACFRIERYCSSSARRFRIPADPGLRTVVVTSCASTFSLSTRRPSFRISVRASCNRAAGTRIVSVPRLQSGRHRLELTRISTHALGDRRDLLCSLRRSCTTISSELVRMAFCPTAAAVMPAEKCLRDLGSSERQLARWARLQAVGRHRCHRSLSWASSA